MVYTQYPGTQVYKPSGPVDLHSSVTLSNLHQAFHRHEAEKPGAPENTKMPACTVFHDKLKKIEKSHCTDTQTSWMNREQVPTHRYNFIFGDFCPLLPRYQMWLQPYGWLFPKWIRRVCLQNRYYLKTTSLLTENPLPYFQCTWSLLFLLLLSECWEQRVQDCF